jgi:regulator of ribonuclease activity A
LVVDGSGSLTRALFGDAMATRAISNGWGSVVVNGAIRDVAKIDSMQISVKALGMCPCRGSMLNQGCVDVPISFGGVVFSPRAWPIGG